jgi:hypothetical protein
MSFRFVSSVPLVLFLAQLTATAAVFQYAVPVATPKGESAAFLWIPPQAMQVRGVVMAGMTLMEREFVKDAAIRQACADEQLPLVFLKCGLGAVDIQKVLDDLARVSGCGELAVAPLCFVGHSAGGPQAKECAIKCASRCFGVVQYRGGVPGGTNAVPPGVPALMMIGQFDEFGGTMRDAQGREGWEGGRDALAAFRTQNEHNLGSLVVEPGAGHFAWSERNAAYLALFLRKAAQARIPKSFPVDAQQPIVLREISARSGWLTDLTIKAAGHHAPAPFDQYSGPKTNAAWHFDREMAEATVAYHAGGFGKKDQFIKWNDPCYVDAGARFFFTKLQWIGDGQTFEVHPVYADKYPGLYDGRGPRWPEAGKPVGHSDAPILVRPVGGPVTVTGPNAFRIQFDALTPASEGGRVTFLAYSRGDREYRYTEQVGMMPRGFSGLKGGKAQTIPFPPMGDLRPASPPVKLAATSDAGLPVEFYVAVGPAQIVNDELRLAELPRRVKFPITIKVVAWQFGRALEPMVQTAAPVEQSVRLLSSP